jgi:NarL family two-component system sensor histidine kinase YdfH
MDLSIFSVFTKFFQRWRVKIETNKNELPFFWFLTFVLSGFYLFVIYSNAGLSLSHIFLASVLMILFIAMFWFSLAFDMNNLAAFSFYLFSQITLCVGMVLLLQNNFMILSAFGMSLIGQITGIPFTLARKMITITVLATGMLLGMWLIEPQIFTDPLPFFVGIIVIIVFQLVFTGVYNQTASAKRDLEEANEKLELANVKIEQMTRAEERQRIARELHDTLAQGLTGIILQLDAVDHYLGKGDAGKAQELVQRSMRAARETLAESRVVIDDLRLTTRDISFIDRVNQLIKSESTDFTFNTALSSPLNLQEETLIEKLISECVLNIYKHARANMANISLYSDEEVIKLAIMDDGIGFDPEQITNKKGHYGFMGMRERIQSVNGHFELNAQSGKGCSIAIIIPRIKE